MVLMAGCGKNTGSRVHGTIVYEGKPIPGGKIYFEPDAGKGNTGPSGFADIVNGHYDTSEAGGQNVHPGPTILTVQGTAPLTEVDRQKNPDITHRLLFQDHSESIDVPSQGLQHDIVVPATSPKPAAAGRGI